jgi:hypothetical protein
VKGARVGLVAGIAACWFLLLASPARADDCARLIKEKGHKAVLTNPAVIQDCLRTGHNWALIVGATVGGGGILIGLGGLPTNGHQPPTEDQKNEQKDCERLLGEFETKKAEWETKLQKATKDLRLLRTMYEGLRRMEQQRQELIDEQQGALSYLMAAGGLAGGVAAAIGGTWAAAMAKKYFAVMELGAAYGPQAVGLRTFTEAGMKYTYYNGLATRAVVQGPAAGVAAGAVTGKVVQKMMETGLEEFNASAQAHEDLVRDFERTCDQSVGGVKQIENDLQTMKSRLASECGITAEFTPAQLPEPKRRPSPGIGTVRG